MRVGEIMTRQVKTVPPTMPIADARTEMRQARFRHLVVVANQKVIGVLSDRDLPRAGNGDQGTVADAMTGTVVTAAPDETVRAIANRMRGRSIGCLPIVQRKKLVGIVTASDLLTLLGQGYDRPARAERHALNHRVAHRKSHGAFGTW
jgi:acetoin utilization protein AcuB